MNHVLYLDKDQKPTTAKKATRVRVLTDDGRSIWGVKVEEQLTANAFCPTGEGGRQDNSCSPRGGRGKQESLREIKKRLMKEWPRAGKMVGGLRALRGVPVPNTDSISASMTDYEELPGIREVPLSAFKGLGDKSYSAERDEKVDKLATRIKKSGKIVPLIVVYDKHPDNPSYILEGGHRSDALARLGVKSLPALVVLDRGAIREHSKKEPTKKSESILNRIWNAVRGKKPTDVMNIATVNLFVYGTFKDADTLDRVAGRDVSRGPATLDDYRHDTGTDGYSYLRRDPSSSVPGYLVRLTPQELQKTDRWETRYEREWVTLKDGTRAWAYFIDAKDIDKS